MFNQATIVGNAVADPEIRTVGADTVAKLRLASNRKYTTKAGEAREEAFFVDVEVWGRTAEVVGDYVKKGKQVLAQGRLKTEEWEKDGEKRSKTIIVADTIKFLGSKEE